MSEISVVYLIKLERDRKECRARKVLYWKKKKKGKELELEKKLKDHISREK